MLALEYQWRRSLHARKKIRVRKAHDSTTCTCPLNHHYRGGVNHVVCLPLQVCSPQTAACNTIAPWAVRMCDAHLATGLNVRELKRRCAHQDRSRRQESRTSAPPRLWSNPLGDQSTLPSTHSSHTRSRAPPHTPGPVPMQSTTTLHQTVRL